MPAKIVKFLGALCLAPPIGGLFVVISQHEKSTNCWTNATNVLFKRNANAFSLNAIVDVRRRHEMIFV